MEQPPIRPSSPGLERFKAVNRALIFGHYVYRRLKERLCISLLFFSSRVDMRRTRDAKLINFRY